MFFRNLALEIALDLESSLELRKVSLKIGPEVERKDNKYRVAIPLVRVSCEVSPQAARPNMHD